MPFLALGAPVSIGTTVTRSVESGKWDYFELVLPPNAPVYQDNLISRLDSKLGDCGFVISDSRVQFATIWKEDGYQNPTLFSDINHLHHSTPVDLVKKNALSVSVYAKSDCRYSGSFNINATIDSFCEHGTYKDGLCNCSNRWAGPNCDKFNFPIVYTMAIAAGTFIIGALISSVLAGCIFHRRAEQSNPSNQGYEQYR